MSSLTESTVELTAPEFDVLEALTRLEIADAGLRSRLRTRLALNATDLAAVQYIDRAMVAGRNVHAKDLAAVLGVSSPAATAVVNRLVAAGHVVRAADPDNGRYRRLTITSGTKVLLDEVVGDTQARLRDLAASLGHRERKRAVEVILAIAEALDDGAHPRPPLPVAD